MCALYVKSLSNSQFSALCLSYLCSINTCISDCLFVSQMFYQRKNLRNRNCMNIISVVFILLQYHTCHISVRIKQHTTSIFIPLHICSQHIILSIRCRQFFRNRRDHSINYRITVTGRTSDSNYYIALSQFLCVCQIRYHDTFSCTVIEKIFSHSCNRKSGICISPAYLSLHCRTICKSHLQFLQIFQFFLIGQDIKLRLCFKKDKTFRIFLLQIRIIQQILIL